MSSKGAGSPQTRRPVAERAEEPDRSVSVDPDETPFELPPIEGLPFKKGSEEDRAIEAIIREADETRAKQGSSSD
jgi:hypothetical protein